MQLKLTFALAIIQSLVMGASAMPQPASDAKVTSRCKVGVTSLPRAAELDPDRHHQCHQWALPRTHTIYGHVTEGTQYKALSA
ncbi:hypothetical protein CVT24_011846 [Panaeolus cyanescens]|uniref:Uncharacterized protein n=1 Tax=Panaeolus cyanescens TaxID=181874 RepID=A0A409YP90_9AGAR|nr:hypothetical protein CVT24_011846 [Panaeolus cyanescens]